VLTVDFERLGLGAGDRLLDLGCGGGRHAFEAFRRGARVIAFDLDADEVRGAAELLSALYDEAPSVRPGAVQGNALALPFEDASFERIIASEVLEHIPEDGAAMAELARVLKPGGVMAVTVPRWFPERVCWALSDEYHSNPGGHVRIYTSAELRKRLRTAGLEPFATGRAHALHTPYWWLKCAVGVRDEDAVPVRLYHRFLVWDITKRPKAVRTIERALDPVLGKSLVVYVRKTTTRVGEKVMA